MMKITYGRGFVFHRDKVDLLQSYIDMAPQVDCKTRWYFAPGICAREIIIPAGTVLIGAVHKTKNIAVLSSGRMILATHSGPIEIYAPYTLTVMPGDKNATTALENCVWTNFFPNPDNEQNTNKLVERYCESKESDLLGGETNKQLAANRAVELEE